MPPLFQFNFDKPGPGVNPDAPRKTGYRRFEELLLESGGRFFKSGLLACLGLLPFYFGLSVSVSAHLFPLMLLSGLLGGMIAGPQITCLADTVLRAQRDEPGNWWLTYKAAWKQNWKASLVPGALAGFLAASLVYMLAHLNLEALSVSVVVSVLISALLSLAMLTYIFPQVALFDMGLLPILKNALLLTLRHPLRTLAAAAAQLLYWGLFLAYFPLTQLLLPLTGLWFPMFLGLSIVYKPMEADFDLENRVKAHQEARFHREEA